MSQTKDIDIARRIAAVIEASDADVSADITDATGTQSVASSPVGSSPAPNKAKEARRRVGRLVFTGSTALSVALTIPAIGVAETLTGGQSSGAATNSFTVTVPDFTHDQTIFDSDAARGANAANIPISGTTTDAPDGTQIEARIVDEGGAQVHPWTTIATAAGGSWSGTYPLVPRNTNWLRVETRPVGSSAPAAQPANRFGVGLVVFLSEQSSMDRGLSSSFNHTAAETIGNAPGDFQYLAIENRNYPNPDPIPATIRDREFVHDGNPRTAALAAMAASFAKAAPGLKVMVLFDTKVGTAQTETLRDSQTDRDFSNVLLLSQAARVDGTEIGLAVLSHYRNIPETAFADYYPWAWLGLDPAGSPEAGVDTGAAFADVTRNFDGTDLVINHVWSEAFPGLLTGRTQMATLNPGSPTEDEVISTNSRFEDRKQSFDALAARMPANFSHFGESATPLSGISGAALDIHPDHTDDRGLPERFRLFAHGILRGTGLNTWTLPEFDIVEWTANYLRLASSAGPITTTHRARGGSTNFPTDPASGSTPGQAELVGFVDGTLTPPTRVEITDAGGQTASGDTILDPGTGQPVGAGHVIIYPEAGQTFDGLSKMYYWLSGHGETVGTFTNNVSNNDGAPWMTHRYPDHLPIVDVGIPNLDGWQLQRFSDVETINAANTLPATDVYTVTGGSPSFASTAQFSDPNDALTVEVRFQRGAGSGFRAFAFGTHNWGKIAMQSNGDLLIEFAIPTDINTKWISHTVLAAALGATDDGLHTLRVALDAANQLGWVYLDDVLVATLTSAEIAATADFRGNQTVELHDSGDAAVAYLRVWREIAANGATPPSPPWMAVVSSGGAPVYTGAQQTNIQQIIQQGLRGKPSSPCFLLLY